ncbi:MAG: hypothetical protein ACRDNS_18880, partial [Trebonia sp.]
MPPIRSRNQVTHAPQTARVPGLAAQPWPGEGLIAPRLRIRAGTVIVVALGVLAWLGARYANQSQPGAFDRAVDDWFTGHVDYRTALWFADLGNAPVVFVVSVAVVGWCVWLRYPRGVLLAVLAPICSTCLTEYALKPLVNRSKDGFLAYPSA